MHNTSSLQQALIQALDPLARNGYVQEALDSLKQSDVIIPNTDYANVSHCISLVMDHLSAQETNTASLENLQHHCLAKIEEPQLKKK